MGQPEEPVDSAIPDLQNMTLAELQEMAEGDTPLAKSLARLTETDEVLNSFSARILWWI
jgi:hypothetical protein